jgi:serine phosphatase RsbU (regulator of sigma subunit)
VAAASGIRRPLPPVILSRRIRGFLAMAYALIIAAVVADLVTGPRSTLSPVLAALPVLASTGSRRPLVPLLGGALAVVGVTLLAFANPGVPLIVHATAGATVLAVTVTSTAAVVLVASRERELAQVRSVSEAAQRALLRPVPARIGSLSIAVRYLAAEAEARIGGDLYEVLSTPYGTRVILGDVRGKGLQAVETAADVLGAFRDAARAEPDLALVAAHLDASLARRPASEEFVTAVLLSLPESGGSARMVNCGHPDPLLLRDTGVAWADPEVRLPPLAMGALVGEHYRDCALDFGRGDLLLLYTDGVSEARDASGRFYPVAQRLGRMRAQDPGSLLDRLIADLTAYVPHGLTDDTALLALRRDA